MSTVHRNRPQLTLMATSVSCQRPRCTRPMAPSPISFLKVCAAHSMRFAPVPRPPSRLCGRMHRCRHQPCKLWAAGARPSREAHAPAARHAAPAHQLWEGDDPVGAVARAGGPAPQAAQAAVGHLQRLRLPGRRGRLGRRGHHLLTVRVRHAQGAAGLPRAQQRSKQRRACACSSVTAGACGFAAGGEGAKDSTADSHTEAGCGCSSLAA